MYHGTRLIKFKFLLFFLNVIIIIIIYLNVKNIYFIIITGYFLNSFVANHIMLMHNINNY